MRCQIIAHKLQHGFSGFCSAAAVVWVDDDILEGQKARIDVWFIPENVETGTGNAVIFERVKQGRFVHNEAARHIHEIPIGA